MLKDNEEITIPGPKLIEALSELEYMLISLKKISRHYYDNATSPNDKQTDTQYALETTNFIDKNEITRRLAKVRKIISESFNNELGPDDMSDIERALEHLKYWKKPGD